MAVSFSADDVECVLIEDGGGGLPASAMFGDAPEAERDAALGERLRPDGRVLHPYGCLVLRTRGSVILVDAGLGSYEHPYGGSGGRLEAELDHLGLVPADVDVVVITHGHLDHIGGLCHDGSPRFVRARHLMSEAAWRWWTDEANLPAMSTIGAQVAREQLLPLDIELTGPRAAVVPGVRLLDAPGHSPGQLALELGGRALYLADAIVDELHAEHPDWAMSFEPDPVAVQRTRRELLGRAADEGLLVAAPHLRFTATVKRAGHGFALEQPSPRGGTNAGAPAV
jgi:glyoxylase-like metal-dependent hydrolase (beta-lactamase superfamily II)